MKPTILFAPLLSGAMLLAMKPALAPNTSRAGIMTVTGITQEFVYINSYSMTAPSAAATSKGTVVVTKAVDLTSPKFQGASSSGKILESVVIQLERIGTDGKPYVFQKITLRKAVISNYTQTGSSSEQITFSFHDFQTQDFTQPATTATHVG